MIINFAMLVVGNYEERLLPSRSVPQRVINTRDKAFAKQNIVGWVLIIRHSAQQRVGKVSRLNEAIVWQSPGHGVRHKVFFE